MNLRRSLKYAEITVSLYQATSTFSTPLHITSYAWDGKFLRAIGKALQTVLAILFVKHLKYLLFDSSCGSVVISSNITRISNDIFHTSSTKFPWTHTQAISNSFPLRSCALEYDLFW